MSSWTCQGKKLWGRRLLPFPPPPFTGITAGSGGKGTEQGGGWVRRLCLCKSACWCIYGPLCILCDCWAQLSMAPLCLGLSLHICSMSLPALLWAAGVSVCPRLPGGSRWFALPSPSGTPPSAGHEHL